MKRIQESWKPQSFTVDRVHFISRVGFLDPYRVRHTVGLGQGLSSPCRVVDIPYVATVGPDSSPSADGLVQTSLILSHAQLCCKRRAYLSASYLFQL